MSRPTKSAQISTLAQENRVLRAFIRGAGMCLCRSAIEDPGEHSARCPWGDDRYAEEPCTCAVPAIGPRTICITCAGELSSPPPAKPLTLTKEAVRDLTTRVASPPPTMVPPIDVAVDRKEGR